MPGALAGRASGNGRKYSARKEKSQPATRPAPPPARPPCQTGRGALARLARSPGYWTLMVTAELRPASSEHTMVCWPRARGQKVGSEGPTAATRAPSTNQ